MFLSTEGIPTGSLAGPPPGAGKGEARADLDNDDHRRRVDRDEDRDRRDRRRDDDDRRSRRRDDDDDYDRSRRRRDDDDDYDDRRRRRRDDDDDYDRRRRRRDDDDYDRPRRSREEEERAVEGQFNRASLACLLCFIGGWLQVGGLGLMVFVVFLWWAGIREGISVFVVLAGLLGLGHWLTSSTGLGFLVSGPRRRGALGLSIATAATAGLHLMLVILIATSRYYGNFGLLLIGYGGDVHWHAFVTQLRAIPTLLFLQIGVGDYYRQSSDGSLLPVIANLAEVARGILFLLTLRAIMLCVRDSRGATLAMKAMIGYAIGAGALLVVGMLFGLLLLGLRPSAGGQQAAENIQSVVHLYQLVLYLVITGLAVGTNLIVRSIKGRIDYRR
ncbi:MAG TPA: hypothetical protein VKD90_07890 [Gemmataceae bacterium]|nr:hypothetical protein [Gemmataceae bacterium]